MYLVTLIVIFVIALIIGMWVMGAYNFIQPTPQRPDANFQKLIDAFDSKPSELWFRNKECIFEKELKGSCFRYVILESDGRVVYDSQPNAKSVRDYFHLRAYDIPRTVEYQRASVTLQGVALRGQVANLCNAVKEGSRYRMVHISSYLYDYRDPEY